MKRENKAYIIEAKRVLSRFGNIFLNIVITDIIRLLTYLTLSTGERKQIPPATKDRHKKPTGNELYGRNLCAVLFFFSAWRGYLCIYGFLEETRGSVYALCACQTARDEASEKACEPRSQRLCATCWAAELCLELSCPSEEDYSHQIWDKKRDKPFVCSLNLDLFFLMFWIIAPKDLMLRDPSWFWTFFFKIWIQHFYLSLV